MSLPLTVPLVHQGNVVGQWYLEPFFHLPRPTTRNPNPTRFTSNYTPRLFGNLLATPVTTHETYLLFTKRTYNFPFQATIRFHHQLALDMRRHFHTPMPCQPVAPSSTSTTSTAEPPNNLQVLTCSQHGELHPGSLESSVESDRRSAWLA